MPFFKTCSLTLLTMSAALAFAAPSPGGGGEVSQCDTGKTYCCDTIQSSNSQPVQSLLGLLGVALGDLPVQVGLGCTSLSIVGLGAQCTNQPVCCENNQFNGLINLGCSPLSL